jgi:halimadienyl-diphosphate synthase
VVVGLAGLANDLVRSAVRWVLTQQHENGSWGFGEGTSEETAWAMNTLLTAGQQDGALGTLCDASLSKGRRYLIDRFDEEDHPALWIGKSLYTPRNIVRAIILSVLFRCEAKALGSLHE